MIKKLFINSRTTEVDAVSSRIIGAYKKHDDLSSDIYLPPIFNSLEASSERLNTAIKRSKAESELDEKDMVRDELLRSLNFLLKGFIHHPDETLKVAAIELEAVFEKYGLSIINESYASESSLVTSLLGDLSQESLQPSITNLPGCTDIINGLQAAQDEFERTRIIYEEDKAKDGASDSATIIKKEVVGLINDKLVIYLRAMVKVDEDKYGEFANTVAQMINDNNEAIKKRTKKPAVVG